MPGICGETQASVIGAIMSSEPPAVPGEPARRPQSSDVCGGRWLRSRKTGGKARRICRTSCDGSQLSRSKRPNAGPRRIETMDAVGSRAGRYCRGTRVGDHPISPGAGSFSGSPFRGAAAGRLRPDATFGVSPDAQFLATLLRDKIGAFSVSVYSFRKGSWRTLPGSQSPVRSWGPSAWSPDSRWIVWQGDNKLWKFDVLSDARPVPLYEGEDGMGADWSREDVILVGGAADGIRRISPGGGQQQFVTKVDSAHNQVAHDWPSFLPDGRHFLYLARSRNPEESAIWIGSLDGEPPKCSSGAVIWQSMRRGPRLLPVASCMSEATNWWRRDSICSARNCWGNRRL